MGCEFGLKDAGPVPRGAFFAKDNATVSRARLAYYFKGLCCAGKQVGWYIRTGPVCVVEGEPMREVLQIIPACREHSDAFFKAHIYEL